MMTEKKILGVIDHFGSGGSQRQFVYLMNGFVKRGYKVSIFTYHESQKFFRNEIDEQCVTIFSFDKKKIGWSGVVKSLIFTLKEVDPDFVVSFLHIPNLLCEFTGFLTKIRCLIVSERTSRHYDRNPMIRYFRRVIHTRASKVVVNSNDHFLWMKRRFPSLKDRPVCIYNGVDPRMFEVCSPLHLGKKIRFVGVGRVDSDKNPLFIVKSLIAFANRNGWCPQIEWVGRVGHRKVDKVYFKNVSNLIASNDAVRASWRWIEESKDIVKVLGNAHVLIHPSRYEGLPNVICEALAMGRPILASRVCEHPYLLGENEERGFLFDLDDPESLSRAIERITSIGVSEWEKLTARCKAYAEINFGFQKMVDSFESLLKDR